MICNEWLRNNKYIMEYYENNDLLSVFFFGDSAFETAFYATRSIRF